MKEPPQFLDAEARERIHAAKNAAQAEEIARQELPERAADYAVEKIADRLVDEQRIAQIVEQKMRYVLTQGTKEEREAIIARVPYICEDIRQMKIMLEGIQDKLTYSPLIQKLVFSMVSFILLGALGAVMGLIFIQ